MPAVSLTTLRARVRELSDNASTTFVTDTATSLDAFINTGVQKLHDIILDAAPSDPPLPVSTSSLSFTISAGTAAISTPADFYELLGVDLSISGSIIDAKRFTRKERNALRTQTVYLPRRTPQYMLDGTTLRINGQDGAYTGTLYYVPAATLLVNAGDTVSYPNGWEHYAVLYAAILVANKEETDASLLLNLLAMEEQRIAGASKTDMGSPPRMVDVQQPFTDSDNPWEV